MNRRRFMAATLTVGASATLPKALAADPFPTQAVRIVVASTPGTVMDASGRLVARHMEPLWRHPVIVIHQPGAGGAIGTDTVAKAKPDGHTLLVAHEGNLVIQPLIQKAASPRSDVRPVAPLTEIELLLVVNKASGIRSLGELIAEARKRPGGITYASAGNGTPVHLRTEMLKLQAGIDLLHVPYKSTAAGMTDLVGGHVGCMLVGVGPAMPHVAAEKLNVLATAGPRRSPLLPDVPTFSETFPGFSFTTWFALFAPAETPREIIDRISHDVTQAIQAPAVKKTLLDQGITAVGGTPEQLDEIVRKDFAEYSQVIKSAKLNLAAL
jgi:tripartite-type tricarboxylate transporter receptor subunit TctC